MLAAMLCMQSCDDDETYDVVGNPDNLVYFNVNADNTLSYNIVNTPVGHIANIDGKLPVKILRKAAAETQVTAEIDNSLVDAYNTEHGTAYAAAPAGAATLQTATTTIRKDTVGAKEPIIFTIPEDKYSQFTEPAYLVPVVIKAVKGDGKGSIERGTAYIILNVKERVLQDAPSALIGTVATNDQKGEWSVVSSTGLGDLNPNGWLPLGARQASASFVIDLGATHNFTGFNYSGYTISSITFSISADNATWVKLDTEGCGTFGVGSGWSAVPYYVLYGGIPTRYVKGEIAFDTNNYYWSYWDYSWGKSYCGLSFNFAFDD